MDVFSDIRASRMSALQIRAVGIALALIILDGFDIAIMAFVASPLSKAWGIPPAALGVLLSASLFGMAAGAILFSPLGDRIGRRYLTTISMAIVSVGMVLSMFSPNVEILTAARVITGVGIGAMSQLNAYVSEFASDRRRGSVVGIYATGFPIGATIAGLVAGPMIPAFGWHSVFAVGAALSILMLVIAWFFLPESYDFLLARRPRGALEKINGLLNKMGRPSLDRLPEPTVEEREYRGIREIFRGRTGFATLMLWTGYACLMAAYYFANSWIPKLVSASTGNDQMGITVGVFLNMGGIIGSLLFAVVAIRFKSLPILVVTLACAAAGYILYGAAFGVPQIAIGVGVLLGVLAVAGVAGFYAVGPSIYSAHSRSTGVGWMVGVGRLVSISSPILVGVLISNGWQPANLFYLLAVPLLVGSACIAAIGISQSRKPSAEVEKIILPAALEDSVREH